MAKIQVFKIPWVLLSETWGSEKKNYYIFIFSYDSFFNLVSSLSPPPKKSLLLPSGLHAIKQTVLIFWAGWQFEFHLATHLVSLKLWLFWHAARLNYKQANLLMVMLEPLISLIVCSCLGGPGLSALTNHHGLHWGWWARGGEWEEQGKQKNQEGEGEQHEGGSRQRGRKGNLKRKERS